MLLFNNWLNISRSVEFTRQKSVVERIYKAVLLFQYNTQSWARTFLQVFFQAFHLEQERAREREKTIRIILSSVHHLRSPDYWLRYSKRRWDAGKHMASGHRLKTKSVE